MDAFREEFESARIFRRLAIYISAMFGVMGFIAGLTISLLGAIVGGAAGFLLTFGTGHLIAFLVRRIARM